MASNKRNQRIVVFILTASYLVFSLYCAYLIFIEDSFTSHFSTVNESMISTNQAVPIGPIVTETIYRQEFTAESRYFSGLAIRFATYATTKKCNIFISIDDLSDKVTLYSDSFNASRLVDNAYYNINIQIQKDSVGKRYAICISTDNTDADDAVTIWATTKNGRDLQKTELYGEEYNTAFDIGYTSGFTDGAKQIKVPLRSSENGYMGVHVIGYNDGYIRGNDAGRRQALSDILNTTPTDLKTSLFINDIYIDQELDIQLLYTKTNNYTLLWSIVTTSLILLLITLYYEKLNIQRQFMIITIYFLLTVFTIIKVDVYRTQFRGFPDSNSHISYVVYLDATNKLIPEYKEMFSYVPTELISDGYQIWRSSGTLNYLGHPPLYYHILRIAGSIIILEENYIKVDMNRLESFANIIFLLGLLLAMYIGYSRINKEPLLHLAYAVVLTSIPTFNYIGATVNNDNLAFIGITLFLLGGLRYREQKKGFFTHFILSGGISISMLSKLTAGAVVVFTIVFYIIWDITHERNWRILFNRKVLVMIPLIAMSGLYFYSVYRQTGSIQPSLSLLDLDYYRTTEFYIDPSKRIDISFWQYFKQYIQDYFITWTGIVSHRSMIKSGSIFSIDRITQIIVFFVPMALNNKLIRNQYKPIILCAYMGVLLEWIYQYVQSFKNYLFSGRYGAFSSRYIVGAIAIFAIAITILFDKMYGKSQASERGILSIKETNSDFLVCSFDRHKTVTAMIVVFISLIFYSDFIYLLLNI